MDIAYEMGQPSVSGTWTRSFTQLGSTTTASECHLVLVSAAEQQPQEEA